MMFLQNFKPDNFEQIVKAVNDIDATKQNYSITSAEQIKTDPFYYTEHGLASLGRTIGFPAQFVSDVANTNLALAKDIIADRAHNFFFGKDNDNSFYVREFLGKGCGAVTQSYNFFDDVQAIEIIAASPLAQRSYAQAYISPERLHLRAIDEDNPFKINGDSSPLFFCYFIDNSMVGLSSFKVQLGIYRQACTNGLIIPIKDFIVCKMVHRGTKDIETEFNTTVAFLDEKRDDIRAMLTDLTTAEASIMSMKEEHRAKYLANALTLSKKQTEKVLDLFNNTYDGKTKWGLVNAITEFARDVSNIELRHTLERTALKVA